MSLIAPRRTLTLVAVILVGLGVLIQLAFGHRFGAAAGNLTEMLAWPAYAGAIVLMLAPMGRRRVLLVGMMGLLVMAWAVHLNARFSTTLDGVWGLPNPQAGAHVAIATLFIGPALGLIVGLTTGLLARSQRLRWAGRSYDA